MSIKVFAPASIGNFSVGYDLLGAAVSPVDGQLLGDTVEVNSNERYQLQIEGRFASQLPSKKENNIVHHCYEHFKRELKKKKKQKLSPVSITLSKNLPVGSGLGSSSSSIVAALVALNQWHDSPFSERELLVMMGQMEARISGSLHYDNIAPCYLGGLQLMTNDSSISRPLPWFNDWYIIVANPGTNILTKDARDALPQTIDLTQATEYAQNLAGFIQGIYSRDKAVAINHLHDVIAEPHRYKLLPDFVQHKAKVLQLGADSMGISGSGPTVFAICSGRDTANTVHEYLQRHYNENDKAFSYVCRLSAKGAQQVEKEEQPCLS